MASPGAAGAQSYPTRPIRLVIGVSSGGVLDVGARLLGEELRKILGQPVLVDPRPGAGGLIAAQSVINAPADGYTLLFHPISGLSRVFYKDLATDVLKELQPVSPIWEFNSGILTNRRLGLKSIAELIAYGRANPGKLNYGYIVPTQGLTMEMFKREAGIDMTAISYRGTAQVLTALLAGEVDLVLDGLSSYVPLIEQKEALPILFLGRSRLPNLPEVPTPAEVGIPNLQIGSTAGLWTRAGAPPEVAQKINAALVEILRRPEIEQRILSFGARPDTATPEDFRARVVKEAAFWAEAARLSNYVPQ
jgi:tripartite-type tricarboxylate transporter receptor subunit TctC